MIGPVLCLLPFLFPSFSNGEESEFVLRSTNYLGETTPNQFTAPFLADLNNDTLLDLIVGYHSGFVDLYENTGTSSSPFYPDLVENYLNHHSSFYAAPCAVVRDDGIHGEFAVISKNL